MPYCPDKIHTYLNGSNIVARYFNSIEDGEKKLQFLAVKFCDYEFGYKEILNDLVPIRTVLRSNDDMKELCKLGEQIFFVSKRKFKNYILIIDKFILSEDKCEKFEWKQYTMSQLVELFPLANKMYNRNLMFVNPRMSCRELRKFVRAKLPKEQKKEEDILKQQVVIEPDLSISNIKRCFIEAREKFGKKRQDINVVLAYICEYLGIEPEKVVNDDTYIALNLNGVDLEEHYHD